LEENLSFLCVTSDGILVAKAVTEKETPLKGMKEEEKFQSLFETNMN